MSIVLVQEAGKYLFPDEASQTALDDNWEHTQLRVVRGKVRDPAFLLSVRILDTDLVWYGSGRYDLDLELGNSIAIFLKWL